jgi:hypothetical protein
MQMNSRAPIAVASSRETGVSANPEPDCSNMIISANQASPPRARQGASGNQVPPALPEQSGSFVPPAASANLRHRNNDLFEIAGVL